MAIFAQGFSSMCEVKGTRYKVVCQVRDKVGEFEVVGYVVMSPLLLMCMGDC